MQFINLMMYAAMALTSLFQQPFESESSKKSIFSTDHQVEFPGVVLEAGVYTVSLRKSDEKRSAVQISNQDETQILASLVAVPDHGLRPEDDQEFTFHDVRSDGPQPVHSWFYAGDLVGLEFVYPKLRAKEIAKESNQHVIASDGSGETVILAVTPNGKEIIIDAPIAQTAKRKSQ